MPLPSSRAPDPLPGEPGGRWRLRLTAVGVSALCLLIGLVLFTAVASTGFENIAGADADGWARLRLVLVLDLAVGLGLSIAVGPMRRAGAWNLVLIGLVGVSSTGLAAAAVALARIGERRDRYLDGGAIVLTVAATLAGSLLYRWADGGQVWTIPWEVLVTIAFSVAALLWGRARGTRAALITSLRAQASTARRERDALEREHLALIAQAEAEQRAAIARDMHDSLSHHLSLIAMHAGALEYREDLPAQCRRNAAGTIRASAQAANTELREVLTALREDEAPLPTAEDLLAMAAEHRDSGHAVTLTWEDGPFTASALDGAGTTGVVTIVRIARELLTNARKHAPGQPVSLALRREGEQLVLCARNPVRGAGARAAESAAADLWRSGSSLLPAAAAPGGTGLGLVGVRERVRLLGGTFAAGTDADGTFEVEARLPWTA